MVHLYTRSAIRIKVLIQNSNDSINKKIQLFLFNRYVLNRKFSSNKPPLIFHHKEDNIKGEISKKFIYLISRNCNSFKKVLFESPNELELQNRYLEIISSHECKSVFSNQNFLKNTDLKESEEIISRYIFCNSNSFGESNKAFLNKLLINSKYGIKLAMKLRNDILCIIKSKKQEFHSKAFDDINIFLKNWLSIAFSYESLNLQQITFDGSSGNVLQNIAKGESVHSIRSLGELKRRLHNGRCCYGLFHQTLQDSPLAFIHIALSNDLITSMKGVSHCQGIEYPKYAIFYSVNSPHNSLTGLDLATQLIIRVKDELKIKYPSLVFFSTLSPIPGFVPWLIKEFDKITLPDRLLAMLVKASTIGTSSEKNKNLPVRDWLISILLDPIPSWSLNENLANLIKEPLLYLCTIYLVKFKSKSSEQSSYLPLDPVARFHLRNGAILYNINWMGNPNQSGFSTSAGMMVNYVYENSNGDCSIQKLNNDLYTSNGTLILQENFESFDSFDKRAEYFHLSKGEFLLSEKIKNIFFD